MSSRTLSIEKDKILANMTTFRTGGPISFFVEARTVDEVGEALRFAKEKNIPIRILGGGSNILADDTPFGGLLLRPVIKGLDVRELPVGEGSTYLVKCFEVTVGAGEVWDDLVAFTVGQGMYGLENLSWIPGTVGAAPVQNIGAYGAEVKDTIAFVEGIDVVSGELRRYTKEECHFAYRTSIFKEKLRGAFVITHVGFHLQKAGRVSIGYKDLSEYFAKHHPDLLSAAIKPEEVRNAVIAIRKNKLPDVGEVGTAGSFFKNPIMSRADYDKLALLYPGMPCFIERESSDNNRDKDLVKVPLGWILDKVCGLRGMRVGQVGTWAGQALVLVNYGGATAHQIRAFADTITLAVKEKTGIQVEWEVEWWGSHV